MVLHNLIILKIFVILLFLLFYLENLRFFLIYVVVVLFVPFLLLPLKFYSNLKKLHFRFTNYDTMLFKFFKY